MGLRLRAAGPGWEWRGAVEPFMRLSCSEIMAPGSFCYRYGFMPPKVLIHPPLRKKSYAAANLLHSFWGYLT